MREYLQFYVDGRWVEPSSTAVRDVEDPATEEVVGRVALGDAQDVDAAARAARSAAPGWAASTREERLEALERVQVEYGRRAGDLAAAITAEMGAPATLARDVHVPSGTQHLAIALDVLRTYPFSEQRGETLLVREPIGVTGLITPWNWPLNQIMCKVAPALATGCTVVLKPSEAAPFSAHLFAEALDAAGLPPGVFNLVHGDGPGAGSALSRHPEVDMVSFTGSTRAGVEVARNAADTVKRVHQELGGKSPLVVLDDDLLAEGVARGVRATMVNSGQTCSAPTRLLVPRHRLDEALAVAAEVADGLVVGDPNGPVDLGPVVSGAQWHKVQGLVESGLAEGARLVAGGPGRPDGLTRGHFVRPTVLAGVTPTMRVAREEVFGPVLVVLAYDDLDEAVRLANDTDYGLAAYVSGGDLDLARRLAGRLVAGQVSINGAYDLAAPFGGYRRSGNGRECGELAFAEFLETKAVMGYGSAAA
ncbi:aldehyde dehydrogenase family protein [Microlunatus flavus]|uniref:Aldehyde dehydrogenase (NAD+) n=1 Tax=Microlunatus flavus TaxID=1036181 RepID=A0A1H9H750_9ACTN|nr:aldehyde dehydrogenase family protein [Microlunatus flavus]SEQ58130.1 aldehyde dehydrogenase (NAD+) [Microlunatus flavus]